MNRNGRFNYRLKEAINGQSVRSIAHVCSMSEAVLRKYISGDSTPNVERLCALSKAAGVNVAWLATGEGVMRPGDEPEDAARLDIELLGRIMTIFVEAARKKEVVIPPDELGEIAACSYRDIINDYPPEYREKAIRTVTAIATRLATIYKSHESSSPDQTQD